MASDTVLGGQVPTILVNEYHNLVSECKKSHGGHPDHVTLAFVLLFRYVFNRILESAVPKRLIGVITGTSLDWGGLCARQHEQSVTFCVPIVMSGWRGLSLYFSINRLVAFASLMRDDTV